jgi:hypothetical protein
LGPIPSPSSQPIQHHLPAIAHRRGQKAEPPTKLAFRAHTTTTPAFIWRFNDSPPPPLSRVARAIFRPGIGICRFYHRRCGHRSISWTKTTDTPSCGIASSPSPPQFNTSWGGLAGNQQSLRLASTVPLAVTTASARMADKKQMTLGYVRSGQLTLGWVGMFLEREILKHPYLLCVCLPYIVSYCFELRCWACSVSNGLMANLGWP